MLEALQQDQRLKLVLWAEDDFVLPPETGDAFAAAIGAEPPQRIAGANHFLQEDKGEEIGALIADWLA